MGLKLLQCNHDSQAAEHVSVFPPGELLLVWADLIILRIILPARTAVMKLPSYLKPNKDEV